MNKIRRLAALVLALLMLTAILPAQAEDMTFYTLGSQVADFTVTTWDGKQINLSEVLKEKDMVLLNIWASWCGPCGMEFPFMQEAYEEYADDVEIIAVSCESTDTDDVIRAFAQERGLTFPMAQDTAGLSLAFYATSIPVNVVIDRFGTVCFMQKGAFTNADDVRNIFDAFIGEAYNESLILNAAPAAKPDIPAADESKLAEAMNADGAALSFRNPEDAYSWPMIPAEEDGRLCVMASNAGRHDTAAKVSVTVLAQAGDALAVTFKADTEAACDLLKIAVNGETVKVFGGVRGWTTYAHAFEAAGEYDVVLSYEKDSAGSSGEDVVYIDTVGLLTGDAAAAAVAANPAYPAAEAATLNVLNADAKQIVFEDPTYALMSLFGLADYYIIPGGEAELLATLTAATDPEAAFLVNYYDSSITGVVSAMKEDGYRFNTPLDSMETTGYTYTNIHLYPAADCGVMDVRTVVCFASEENANAFVSMMPYYGYEVSGWSYVDGSVGETDALPGEGTDAQVYYTLTFIDQYGEPVPGVIANVCDEHTCTPMTSDAEGTVEFQNVPYAYDIHVIKVPEGYTFDTAQAFRTEPDGGEMVFVITRAEAAE